MGLLLVDFSQIAIESAIAHFSATGEKPEINIVRHVILNTLIANKSKIGKNSKEVVLCLDDRNYWRRSVFPFYKRNRGLNKGDKFDWTEFFKIFNDLKVEFAENLPYKTVVVESAEADDIIGVLARRFGNQRDVVILSSDKDFIQLQAIAPIRQYSPKHKGFIDAEKRSYSLFEHLVRGDPGDGIPNIVSDDDVFVIKTKRARPILSKNIASWASFGINNPEKFCTSIDMLNRYNRNRTLIDLTKIPSAIEQSVVDQYDNAKVNKNVFNYLVKHKLMKIMERGDI